MVAPVVTLTHLNRADGSATYTHNGYSIIGAVNGPIEVQRRDELPEEAAIEVNVRPAMGVGSPRERHLETLVHNTLRSIILTQSIPRTLVQSLTLLPHLLHTSLLALLSASIPLRTTLTSVIIAQPASPSTNSFPPLLSPTANELLRAKPIRAVHVFAFSGNRKMLMSENDGRFSYEEWAEACEMAETACCGDEEDDDDGGVKLEAEGEAMDIDAQAESENLDQWLRSVVRKKVEFEQRWKSAT
ncbi:conserved hypothetical protein [Pyrenophora tritici-repentis Pt-1C-BFP]|uniref:Exoribonuclease phosphorolytic domain-containing protein n=1 Tax=Pyrenophora tritici-repentis (strain Pt-1C-BFP) TaxID=426418 RepID=B2W7X7_PYRTR|nr:uncharacterized protein PTRG_05915 [Pyrenophora tritici-repentis Pt-1C-BFP]EDU48835.1 conserved hypothetical protein [Pyrenophora tritici-repentis Pt-1C-BFP]